MTGNLSSSITLKESGWRKRCLKNKENFIRIATHIEMMKRNERIYKKG